MLACFAAASRAAFSAARRALAAAWVRRRVRGYGLGVTGEGLGGGVGARVKGWEKGWGLRVG